MSEPIAPALPPEEWDIALCRGDFAYMAATEVTRPHACAALNLYDQPFGFTWEHVYAIGYFLALDTTGEPVDPAEWQRNLALATEAQARIAALLPPRDPVAPEAPPV